MLLKFYQAADQVTNLVQMVDLFDRKTIAEYRQKGYFQNQPEAVWRRTLPTRPIREALRIEDLKTQGKVAELIAIAQDSSWTHTDLTTPSMTSSDWHCELAANALAELGDFAIEPITSEVVTPKANISWLIYALGRSKARNAIHGLEKGARRETSYNSLNYVLAISKHGNEGGALLSKIANQWTEWMQNGVREKAREFLAQPRECGGAWLDDETPKITRGSLPKFYPNAKDAVSKMSQ